MPIHQIDRRLPLTAAGTEYYRHGVRDWTQIQVSLYNYRKNTITIEKNGDLQCTSTKRPKLPDSGEIALFFNSGGAAVQIGLRIDALETSK